MKILNVGVVGSRRRTSEKDKDVLRQILLRRIQKGDNIHLVSGGCELGADSWAEALAVELGLGITIHYPDESKLPPNPDYYDRVRMYYARNGLIARDCNILLAFVAPDRKGGTENTIKQAEKLGKTIVLL